MMRENESTDNMNEGGGAGADRTWFGKMVHEVGALTEVEDARAEITKWISTSGVGTVMGHAVDAHEIDFVVQYAERKLVGMMKWRMLTRHKYWQCAEFL